MLSRAFSGSIRKKLALLFLASALPAFVIISFYGLHRYDETIAKAETELLRFTVLMAETQERTTLSTRLLLESIATLPEVRTADAQACAQIFTRLLTANPHLGAITLTTPTGDVVATTRTQSTNLAQGKHFQDAVATKKFAVGEYMLGRLLPVPLLPFAAPVLDDTGNILGVLLAGMELSTYGNQFKQMHFPEGSFVGACDHKGIRLFRYPESSKGAIGQPIRAPMFAAAKSIRVEGLQTDTGSDGIERIIAFRQLRLDDATPPYMYMFVGTPTATLQTQARTEMQRDLGIFLIAIALTLISGWFFGGSKLGHKLEELAKASGRLGQGDYSARVAPNSDISEITTLSEAFNSMAQSLSRDMAERTRAKTLLEESEQRFKTLHNASFGGIVIHDQGIILDCNLGLSTITGYSYEELIGMDGLLLIAEQSRETVRSNLRSGYEKPYDVYGLRKNQDVYPVRLEARNIPYQGKPVRVTEFRDITESKLAEERLRQSEDRLALALDATSDGLWDWNLETNDVYFSPRYATMLGYSPAELEPSFATWEALLHPDDRHKIKQTVADHIERGEPFTVEFRLKTKDGNWWWVLGRGKVMERDAHGHPTRMVGTHVDIHARKQAETSWHQLTQILENSDSIAVMKDTDLRYLAVNQAYLRLTGFDNAADVAGKTDADLFRGLTSEEHIAEYLQNDRKALALPPGQILSIEESMTGEDGAPRTFLTKKFPVYDRERTHLLGVATLASEITDRKRMEGELLAAKEIAEKASLAKSEFLANMSHEIRTPLNGLMGMLQLLEASKLTPEQDEFCHLAVQCTTRLTRLLSDILDLSRVEAGKMQILSEPFNLMEPLGQTLDLFRPLALQSGVVLKHHLDANLPQTVVGDPVRLQQVLTNLLGNAFKFTPTGQITVEAYPLTPRNDTEARIVFSVSDTGCGIAEKDLARLFQPFTQVSQGFTKNHQGAGLGLTISKNLVRLMGGNMSVESEPGVGTSVYFCITFERQTALHADTAPEPQDPAFSRALRVLLAEDDEVTRFSIHKLLEKAGHHVTIAQNGQEALDLRENEDFDLILMDVQMPVMDGLEATRRIRETGPEGKRSIPIIALTAYAMAGDRETFLAAGMDGYVAKPVDIAKLIRTMERLLTRPRTE
jgi:PAS domain S-box-containing protein